MCTLQIQDRHAEQRCTAEAASQQELKELQEAADERRARLHAALSTAEKSLQAQVSHFSTRPIIH